MTRASGYIVLCPLSSWYVDIHARIQKATIVPRSNKVEMAVFDIADEKHYEDHVESVTNIVAIDNIQVLGLSAEDAEFYTNFSPERRKKLLRKVCSLISLLPLIDAHRSIFD
jgi:hypothetical protein